MNSIKKRLEGLEIKWCKIPAGSFTMGSSGNEINPELEVMSNFAHRNNDEKQHLVILDEFLISKYPITFKQFDFFCEKTGRNILNDNGWGRAERPVINVNWYEANCFANWIGCRLPSEAEWEYACRAGTSTPFNVGEKLTYLDANFNSVYPYKGENNGEYLEKTLCVGSYLPNAWGVHDMHGNVSEWCNDWYDEYPTKNVTNPLGPSDGIYKVRRGGSWYNDSERARSAARSLNYPINRFNIIGFRIATSNLKLLNEF